MRGGTFTRSSLYLYSGLILYIIPWQSFSPLKILFPIVVSILLLELFYNKIKLNKIDLFLSISLFAASLFNFSIPRLGTALVMVVLLLVFRHPQKLDRKFLTSIYFIFFTSIIYQLLTVQSEGTDALDSTLYRFSLFTVPDPNLAGQYILLFMFFCWKNNFRLGIILSFAGIGLFSSRGYFISLMIFFLVLAFEKFAAKVFQSKLYKLFLNQKKFFVIVIVATNILLFSFGTFFTANFTIVEEPEIEQATERLKPENYIDNSNLIRFAANEKTLQLLSRDTNILLYGIPHSAFTDSATVSDKVRTMMKFLNFPMIPHNSVLSFLLDEGILFGIPYFLATARILARLSSIENIKYILPYVFFSLILHGFYTGAVFIFWIATLSLPEYKRNQRKQTRYLVYENPIIP